MRRTIWRGKRTALRQSGKPAGAARAQRRERTGVALAGALQRVPAMLVYRSIALGLLGACLILLADRPPVEVRIERDVGRVVLPPAMPAASIIDVAPGATARELASLIRMSPGEHVAAVDDVPVAGDLDAGEALARLALGAHRYVDLTIARGYGTRRVLVLLH